MRTSRGWGTAPAKTAAVRFSKDTAPRKDQGVVFSINGGWALMPVCQMTAWGVAPDHVSPAHTEGVVRVKRVVFTVEIDQAVGVVNSIDKESEVVLRTKHRLIGGTGPVTRWQTDKREQVNKPTLL